MTKDLRNSLVWIVFATLMIGLAFWQAQMIALKEAQSQQKTLPPPAKTRHAIRSERPATATSEHKQLTNRQLGWLVEDFQTAGLDQGIRAGTPQEFLAQRKTAQLWYRDALVEGLQLKEEQKKEVTVKLDQQFDRAKADQIESMKSAPKPFQQNGKWYVITSADNIRPLVEARAWMSEIAFAPGNLCQLDASQLDLSGENQPPLRVSGLKVLEDTSLPFLREFSSAQLKILLLWEPSLAGKIGELLDSEARSDPGK